VERASAAAERRAAGGGRGLVALQVARRVERAPRAVTGGGCERRTHDT
jgi:hypothetical protein